MNGLRLQIDASWHVGPTWSINISETSNPAVCLLTTAMFSCVAQVHSRWEAGMTRILVLSNEHDEARDRLQGWTMEFNLSEEGTRTCSR